MSFDERGKTVYVGPKVHLSLDSRSAVCVMHLMLQVTARYMDFANWLLAWSRYSLAAAMTKQLTFNAAQQYLSVITDVSHSVANIVVRMCLLALCCRLLPSHCVDAGSRW